MSPPSRPSRPTGLNGSSYLDRAGSDRCIKGWSRGTLQSPQCKSLDSTRIGTGQSSFRGRVRCLTHLIAWERRRREPGSNSVIVTASLTRCEGHVEGRGGLQRVRKIFAGCPAIRPIWDQSPGIRNPRFETVGNRLYPLNGQISLCCSAAEAQIQDRSRAKTGPNTAPGFLRVSQSFPRTPPSFPRRREPRVKQSTPFTPFAKPKRPTTGRGSPNDRKQSAGDARTLPRHSRASPCHSRGGGNPEKNKARRSPRRTVQGGPSDRSERSPKDRHESGVCPGLNPFPRSQGMPTPPSPSMRGNNSGFEIVSTCGSSRRPTASGLNCAQIDKQ